jgi:hypothetical protein
MNGTMEPRAAALNRKNIQDEYTQDEFADILRYYPLERRSKYEINVGPEGKIRFSLIRSRYIQNEDIQAAVKP